MADKRPPLIKTFSIHKGGVNTFPCLINNKSAVMITDKGITKSMMLDYDVFYKWLMEHWKELITRTTLRVCDRCGQQAEIKGNICGTCADDLRGDEQAQAKP